MCKRNPFPKGKITLDQIGKEGLLDDIMRLPAKQFHRLMAFTSPVVKTELLKHYQEKLPKSIRDFIIKEYMNDH